MNRDDATRIYIFMQSMLKQDRDVHMFNYAQGDACTIQNLTFPFGYAYAFTIYVVIPFYPTPRLSRAVV